MKRSLLAAAVLLMFTSAPVVMADHNSPWGEGWANMPNDIHNMRLDTRDVEGGTEIFQDFVQYGSGADSINRCDELPLLPECYDDTDNDM
jgi:hypothetical protein